MASMNTRLNIEKLDGNIVQKHGGSNQVGFKQLGLGVETGVHDEKCVWFEVELQGAQGGREAEVFQVSNDDTAVAQRRLEYKQPEEKTNTDCLSGVAKHLGVAVIQQQNGLVKETNVTLLAKQVALEILAAHSAWVKGSKEIAGLMLMTMELEIQRNPEPLHAHEMLKELKTLFTQQAEQELLQTTRDFHSCRQEEGQSVSSYVLKMKGYIDILERLGHPVTLGLVMGKTVNEFHAMLKLHEQTLPKSNAHALNAIRAGKVQKSNKHKKSHSQKGVKGQNQGKEKFVPKPKILPPPKRENPAKDSICHEKRTQLRELVVQGLRASRKQKPMALSLYVGNGQREAVEAIGAFYLCLPSGLEIVLNNCHYAPSITRGVISVSRLYEDGFVNRFVDNTIQVSRNSVVYFCAIPRDGIFENDLSNSLTNESSVYAMARKPYTHQVERAKDLLGLIHTDVYGPFKIMSRQEASYFVTFTDDFSRYGYVYLLKHKHEVFETFKVFQKEVENQLGKTIKSLRSDRGGEYMSQEFLDHLKDHRIIAHRTPPYTPQHNDVSERRNRTLLDMVRSMTSQTTPPKSFWDYALETAARILNMVPTKKVEKTPYEVWHGKVPKLSYLKVWGCEALVKRDTLTKPDKLEPRSIKCIFVGYPKETMGYSFYYPPENKVIVARNAKFLENSLIDQEASESLEDLEIIQEEDTHPSIDTSLNHKKHDLEIDKPQSDIVLIQMQSMKYNEVWILVELPPNGKTVGSKWLFKKKTDMDGNKFGFTQNRDESCVYLKASGSNITFLILYADDILIMGNNIPMLQSVKTYLGRCFAMKDLGETAYTLRIKIDRDISRRLIGLCQSAYIKKILKRYYMENSKCGSIPMQEKLKLSKSQVVVVGKIYAHEPPTFNNTVACEVISKWKVGLKDDMDARSYAYVLSNGCRKSSDDSDGYYWEYTPGMFIHLFLYIDDMVFSCGCKAEIWATKGLLNKAKGNVLGMEVVKNQSGYTLRVSQSSLSGDCDVEKNGKWSCTYAVGSQEYQMVCTRLDITSADVGMLDKFDRGLQTNVQVFVDFDYVMGRSITIMAGYMTFTEAGKKKIWLKGLLTESRCELKLVAGIAIGALVKGGSRSEVPA
nr:retrotransposon protein, putative, Ty1-copia subclass [Tanacetum cinerariifolium]